MKKKQSSSFAEKVRNVIEKKGFYIALFSLTLIVGFSIYARNVQLKRQQNDLSFDDAAWQQALEESGVEFRGSTPVSESDVITAEETASENTAQPVTDVVESSLPDTATTSDVNVTTEIEEPAVAVSSPILPQSDPEEMQMPCTGETISKCSLNDLVYCAAMGDWRTHNGLDIAGVEGTPVVAAATGTVSQVYEDELLGVVVTLDHGDGITSLYGNLQNPDFIGVGTIVQKGDIIGGIGKPGALEADKEPHLHFEVYKNGELKNPSDFIVS